jgi:hypothetical protein
MGGITKNRYYCATYSSNLTINCCYFYVTWGGGAKYIVCGAQTMAGINSCWWDTNNGEGDTNNGGGECVSLQHYKIIESYLSVHCFLSMAIFKSAKKRYFCNQLV